MTPAAEALVLLAGRQDDLGRRGEDAAALEAVVERVLEGDGDIAKPATPAGVALLHGDRHLHLVLRSRADAALVEEFVHERSRGHGRRQHGLVFGKRLLGDEGSRQVELAGRPGRVVAEPFDVRDGHLDLGSRQRLSEGRHPRDRMRGRDRRHD